jgi:hypothetical protein
MRPNEPALFNVFERPGMRNNGSRILGMPDIPKRRGKIVTMLVNSKSVITVLDMDPQSGLKVAER